MIVLTRDRIRFAIVFASWSYRQRLAIAFAQAVFDSPTGRADTRDQGSQLGGCPGRRIAFASWSYRQRFAFASWSYRQRFATVFAQSESVVFDSSYSIAFASWSYRQRFAIVFAQSESVVFDSPTGRADTRDQWSQPGGCPGSRAADGAGRPRVRVKAQPDLPAHVHRPCRPERRRPTFGTRACQSK